jgi:HPt (histidine-containing phosphotransfer) domain-containing protein
MGATRALFVEVDTELAALVPGFLDRRRSDAVAIRAAALSGDFETARSLGHQLKGSGAGYGFPEISRLGAEIEEAAKGHERERLGGLADALSEYLGSIRINYV